MGSFFNWIIGDGVAKYLGRIAVGKNSLEGLDVTLASSGSHTMAVETMLGGMLIQDPIGAVAANTTPTAAQIVAALGDAAIKGAKFKFAIRNTGTAAEVISLVAGAGVTLSPTTLEVDADEIINLLVRLDNVDIRDDADIEVTVTDSQDADLTAFFAAAAGELYVANGSVAIVDGDVFEVGGTGDLTDNALETAKGSAPADGDLFVVTSITTPAVTYVGPKNEAVTIYGVGLDVLTT